MASNAKVDRAGRALAKGGFRSEEEELEAEFAFDEYRRKHLEPLTEATHLIQQWVSAHGGEYYIAQRLKRRPQILRKLLRFSVRLTQLQDIGGNRIIVPTNSDVDALRDLIMRRAKATTDVTILRETDYRDLGRDDTGYRALHVILDVQGVKIELQLRSRAQHHWAESIERTSVVYGQHLKEGEGDLQVIDYFKSLSHIFYKLESGREPTPQEKLQLDDQREIAEGVIATERRAQHLHSNANDDILHTMSAIERGFGHTISNWILIFDWESGSFVSWEAIPREAALAYERYVAAESMYSDSGFFEVVLVGSSDVSMIRRTHSHYFGVRGYDSVLEALEDSVEGGVSTRRALPRGARRVLHVLYRKRFWGKNTVGRATLQNHYCQDVGDLDSALKSLVEKGFLEKRSLRRGVSLLSNRKAEIESYL